VHGTVHREAYATRSIDERRPETVHLLGWHLLGTPAISTTTDARTGALRHPASKVR
jgi:hypothetical protein